MKRIRFFILGIAIMLMIGCSHPYTEAPKPTNHWFSEQYMVQAAHHWDILALSVASDVYDYMVLRSDLPREIYIDPASNSVFEKNYREYLKSHLTDQGFVICPDDNCSASLTFHSNTIHHPTFPVYTGHRCNSEKRYNHLETSELVVFNDLQAGNQIIGTIAKTLYFKDGEYSNYSIRKDGRCVPTKTFNVSENY